MTAFFDADLYYIIKHRKGPDPELPVDMPLGTIRQWKDDWGAIPDGWTYMRQGEEIPDIFPELRELFAKSDFGPCYPDFRAHILSSSPDSP